MLIDHTMFAPNIKLQKNARELTGFIENCKGDKMALSSESVLGEVGQYDVVTFKDLLDASCTNLDEIAVTNTNRTKRNEVRFIFVSKRFYCYSNVPRESS